MWELDHKESRAEELWYYRKLLKIKEIKTINTKGNQSWIFIGRIDVEAETAMLWLHSAKSQLIRKDPDAWKEQR